MGSTAVRRWRRRWVAALTGLLAVGLLVIAPSAHAGGPPILTISTDPTSGVNIGTGNPATVTPVSGATNPVLNVGDLETLLATGGVVLGSSSTTTSVEVDTSISASSGPATSLTFAVPATVNADITTIGGQTYDGAVSSTNGVTFTTTNAPVTFEGAVTTTHAVTVNAGTGTITLDGALSSAALSLNGGSTVLNGGSVSTLGELFINGPATLGADTTLSDTGGGVFLRSIDGPHALTVSNDQQITIAGSLGSSVPLTSFTLGAGTPGATLFGSITTTGDQSYGAVPLTLQSSLTLASSGGSITASAPLVLSNPLTISGAGTLSGVISGSSPLTKAGAGTLTLSGSSLFPAGLTVKGGLVNFTTPANLGTGNVTLNGGGLQWATGNTTDISSRLNAIGGGGATFDTGTNDLTFASPLTGTGPITKLGTGSLSLPAANTESGATSVSVGALTVGGTLPGHITVQSAATLACVNGTLSGGVTNNGGTTTGAPVSPTGASAVAGDGTATVSFTPQAANCFPVTYTASASPGSAHATGTASPLTVSGLTDNTAYTFTATATNPIGSATSGPSTAVTPESGPPTVGITAPADGQTYTVGQSVITSFGCFEAPGGPGITSCVDGSGRGGGSPLDTSTVGSFAFTATATSQDGETASATVHYTVVAAPVVTPPAVTPPTVTVPVADGKPKITGTRADGHTLTCTRPGFSGSAATYTYAWRRDGTAIHGATSSKYRLVAADEGATISCVVTAKNTAGSVAVTSTGVAVATPKVAGCPAPTGSVTGTKVGPFALGMTRSEITKADSHAKVHTSSVQLYLCSTPEGSRVGFASAKELRAIPASQRKAYTGRAIWISTWAAHYALHGIRAGATVTDAAKALKLRPAFAIGLNDWYLASDGGVTAVLKARHGIVLEIGIADRALTDGSRASQRNFLSSFG